LYWSPASPARYNPALKSRYPKLLTVGTAKKLALIACTGKLLVILKVMLRNKTQWGTNLEIA
jgi:transposase